MIQHVVDIPADRFNGVRPVNLDGVRMEVPNAGFTRASTAIAEAGWLVTRSAGLGTAMQDTVYAVDIVDILHDVNLSDRGPVPTPRVSVWMCI